MTKAADRIQDARPRRFLPYPEYKGSGVEWLGKIPSHWNLKKLKNSVAGLESGGTPESDNVTYWTDEEHGIPWVAISDMTREFHLDETAKRITEEGRMSKRLRVLPAGTLLYSMYASLGKVALLETEAVINQAILGVVPRESAALRDYLRWWFEFMQAHVQMLSSSNTQDNLSAERVRNMPVVLPIEIKEQRAIAAFLDRETAKIDGLVERKKRLIELLQEKRTAHITRAVTRGLDQGVPMKDSGVEWLGEIPAHWDTKKVKRLFRHVKRQGYPDLTVLSVYREYGVIEKSSRDDNFNRTPDDLDVYQQVNPGDLVINKMKSWQGSLGVSSLSGITSPDYVVYAPNHEANERFLHHFLRCKLLVSAYLAMSNGIRPSQWRLEPERFEDLVLFLPPPVEQDRIAAFLDRETARIDALISKIRQAINLLKEFRTALISAAVTGKIDVRAEAP